MAKSPYGNGVILFGGASRKNMDGTGGHITKQSILELKANGQGWVSAWTNLSTKLQYARYKHIVIPVLMEKDICGLDGIVSTTKVDDQTKQLEKEAKTQNDLELIPRPDLVNN